MNEIALDMTKAEAVALDNALCANKAKYQTCMYLIWKGRGYVRLGYATFAAYCENRDTPISTAQSWITQVETSIALGCYRLPDDIQQLDFCGGELLTVRAAGELAKLSGQPEKMQEAYGRMAGLSEANGQAAKGADVKRIVASYMDRPTPKVSAVLPAAVVVEADKQFSEMPSALLVEPPFAAPEAAATKILLKVRVESIYDALNVLNAFDAVPLDRLELTLDGVPIELSQKDRDAWKFTGLSNRMLVDLKYWENKLSQEVDSDTDAAALSNPCP